MKKIMVWVFLVLSISTIYSDQFNRPYIPFPKNDAIRKDSSPFISGDTFRRISDHVFDETNVPFDPAKINKADIVFVNGDMLQSFFSYAYPLINVPFILITHNTDHAIPGACSQYLDEDKVLRWYSQNIDRAHKKLFPLPIGLANYHWPHGKIEIVQKVLQNKKSWSERDGFKAYVNFLSRTNPNERIHVWDTFKTKPFCVVKKNRSYFDYLKDMQECKFVISPPGNGLDCHRHWEALLMGSIPIIKHSSIDVLFSDLPVVLVKDWADVSLELLQSEYSKISAKIYNNKKLFASYWIDEIKNTQIKLRDS